jgi:GMP synthase (glutamine-hydrolysing)
MGQVLVLQHVASEGLGIIEAALNEARITAKYVYTFEGQPIPSDLGSADGLIVMGGYMGVYEQAQYPFLSNEIRLIERTLKAGKPILGTCLGSELLAAALGAKVTKGRAKEIGWYPVKATEDGKCDKLFRHAGSGFVGFHWHGDVFELPGDAVSLASSELTMHQAFRYKTNSYGFLFHMEATEKIVEGMVAGFAEELEEEGIDGRSILSRCGDHIPQLHSAGSAVFKEWVGLIQPSG